MKKFLILLLSTLTLMACADQQPDLTDWLQRGVLVDTRTIEEFQAGAIPGAILLPYDSISKTITQVAADQEIPILLYCRSGRRAGIAEKKLKSMGYRNVINLGGLREAYNSVIENR